MKRALRICYQQATYFCQCSMSYGNDIYTFCREESDKRAGSDLTPCAQLSLHPKRRIRREPGPTWIAVASKIQFLSRFCTVKARLHVTTTPRYNTRTKTFGTLSIALPRPLDNSNSHCVCRASRLESRHSWLWCSRRSLSPCSALAVRLQYFAVTSFLRSSENQSTPSRRTTAPDFILHNTHAPTVLARLIFFVHSGGRL